MSTHTFNPSTVRPRLKAVAAAALSLVAVIAMASFWIWNSDAEGRALRQLWISSGGRGILAMGSVGIGMQVL